MSCAWTILPPTQWFTTKLTKKLQGLSLAQTSLKVLIGILINVHSYIFIKSVSINRRRLRWLCGRESAINAGDES